jgi:hypothetical protein
MRELIVPAVVAAVGAAALEAKGPFLLVSLYDAGSAHHGVRSSRMGMSHNLDFWEWRTAVAVATSPRG